MNIKKGQKFFLFSLFKNIIKQMINKRDFKNK